MESVKIQIAGRKPNGKTVYVKKNGKLTLRGDVVGTGVYDTKVLWSTSNPKVATVTADGKVKVKAKKGSAVITAVSAANPEKSASVTVKASAKKIANKKLTLKKRSLTLKAKDEKAQIQIKALTNKTTDSITYKVKSGKQFVSVDKWGWNGLLMKVIANIIVIILNFILSKLVIFTKKK